MQKAKDVENALSKKADPKRAEGSMRFFKTEKGSYGAHDSFIGVTVPEQRKIAKEYRDLPLPEIKKLLKSKIHENRLTALFILVLQFEKGDKELQTQIKDFYLDNIKIKAVNNWDLVDSSAHKILGAWLLDKDDRTVLYDLAKSKDLWEKRIAMVATWWFIKYGQLDDTFKIAEILLHDDHDLVHKAVGWMLREAGKKDQKKLEEFLYLYAASMPRTTLRYAIEKFSIKERCFYLKKK